MNLCAFIVRPVSSSAYFNANCSSKVVGIRARVYVNSVQAKRFIASLSSNLRLIEVNSLKREA